MGHLNTYESFDYMWLVWRFVGIYPYERLTWLYNIYAILVNLLASVISPIHVFINVFFVDNFGLIMQNMQYSPTLIVSSLKQLVIFLKISNLKRVRFFTDQLDRRASLNKDETEYLKKIIKQCRHMAYAVQVSLIFSLLSYAVPALIKKQLVFEGWFPFDWTASRRNYFFAFDFQLLATTFQIIQATGDDAYPLLYINLLRGHIHALGMRVAKIGRDPSKSLEENFIELKACVADHKNIIGYFEAINPVVSRSVLVQFVITAFVLCISVVYYLLFNRGFGQLISTLVYMCGILSESFPVCFIANVLMIETEELTTAIYDCNWMDQSPEFRKCVIIFMQRSHQKNIIKAGLVPISLETYIDIIRFSFSVFTVLSEMN